MSEAVRRECAKGGIVTETPHDVLHDALNSHNLSNETKDALRRRMESALESERASIRQECFVAMLHASRQAADALESLGGSDNGEPDCPREPGSKHARPEGLSAGARARFWH